MSGKRVAKKPKKKIKKRTLFTVFSMFNLFWYTVAVLVANFHDKISFSSDDENVWMGVTVTRSSEKRRIDDLKKNIKARHYHVTFEPLFDDIGEIDFEGIDWIVIGTETGNRKGKSYSRPEWVLSIAKQAKAHGIPVFMKEDLLPIMGDERMIQELPEQFTRRIQ